MLKPGLTFGEGLETIWPVRFWNEWMLSPDDPLVSSLIQSTALFDHLIRAGALVQVGEASRPGPRFDQHKEAFDHFRRLFAGSFDHMDARIDSRKLRAVLKESEHPRKTDQVRFLIREILLNVLEHGTQNLRAGSAEARWAFGDGGFVFGLEQRPPFRNFEGALQVGHYEISAGDHKKQRGKGLMMSASSDGTWFWVNQKPNSSETIILATAGN